MQPSSRRLLSLVVAVTFAAAVLAPDGSHGCAPGGHEAMAHRTPEASGHGERTSPHHGQVPSRDCNCIGHPCCGVVPLLPAAPRFSRPAVMATAAEHVVRFRALPVTRPARLLPPAQAPPPAAL